MQSSNNPVSPTPHARFQILWLGLCGVLALLFISASLIWPTTAAQAQGPNDKWLYDNDELFEQLSGAARIRLEQKYGKKPSSVPPLTGFERPIPPPEILAPLNNYLVNNPLSDATASDTQSETSMVLGAGNTVIVAYNDSGNTTNNHFSGIARSTNKGSAFTDLGTLPTDLGGVGDAGDPVLARDNLSGRIYLITLGFASGDRIQLFTSDNDGITYSQPTNAAPGYAGTSDFLDKPWLTVDNFAGAGQGNVYLMTRVFPASGSNGIRFYRSTDGGATWGPNQGLLLTSAGSVQGAFVVVGPDHTIYAFWHDSNFSPRQIRMRKSTDQGQTFSAPVTVATLNGTGINGDLGLNGGFRTNSFPQIAVNPVSGHLYIVYNDDPVGADKANVYFQQSTDGGNTWSAAVQVNDDSTINDQFIPALAVTPDGTKLAVTFYDRRFDPTNNLIDRFGVVADIVGAAVSFRSNFRITNQSFPVVIGVDPNINPIYMGDYDQMAADNSFFYTVWGDNSDTSIAVPSRRNANVRLARFGVNGADANLLIVGNSLSDPSGNLNGIAEPGETIALNVRLKNVGGLTATTVSGSIALISGTATILTPTVAYPNITSSATTANATPFIVTVSPSQTCETFLTFVYTATYNTTDFVTTTLVVPIGGTQLGLSQSYIAIDTPKAIPDNNATGITSTITISSNQLVGDVNVRFNITHTYDFDLQISLISPQGTTLLLVNQRGGSGDNFTNTIIDDEAGTAISAGGAPFSGSFRPEVGSELSKLDGQPISGTWTLRVADRAGFDTGTLSLFRLDIQPLLFICNTPPLVSLSNSAYSVTENGGAVVITATLSTGWFQTATVGIIASDGTAVNTSDYAPLNRTLTFAPGITQITTTIAITDDLVFESNETFTVSLSNPTVVSFTTPYSAIVTIVDNEPTVRLSSATYSVNETGGSRVVTAILSNAYSSTVSVGLSTSDNTASRLSDYVAISATLTFTPGVTTISVTIPITDDLLFNETNETFTVTLSNPVAAALAAPFSAAVTIVEVAPVVQFNNTPYTIAENGNALTTTLTLNRLSIFTSTVQAQTADGTASSASDYAAINQIITFTPGITSAAVTVPITDDLIFDGDETFNLNLSNPVSITTGANTTVTILDNEAKPIVQFSANSYSADEDEGPTTITVTLSAPVTPTITVRLSTSNGSATAGSDYLAISTTLTFAPGVTMVTTILGLTGDYAYEGNESLSLVLSNPVNATLGANGSVTFTILDNDPVPTVQFNSATYTATENAGSATITVTLSAASGLTTTINYTTTNGTATAGNDYTTTVGTLTFAPGITTRAIVVGLQDDTLYEGNESLSLSLGNPLNATLGAPSTATLTILDNDPAPTVQFGSAAYNVNEDAGVATITVTLSAATSLTATVNYATSDGTATASNDYTTTVGTLTFAPNTTSRTFTVPIISDSVAESSETLSLILSNPTVATAGVPISATLTIVNVTVGQSVYLPLIVR